MEANEKCGKNEEAIETLKSGQKDLWGEVGKNRNDINSLKEAHAKNEVKYESIKLLLEKIEYKLENRSFGRIVEKVIEYIIIFFIAWLLSGRFSNERIGNSKGSINKTRGIQTESVSMYSRKSDNWSRKECRG